MKQLRADSCFLSLATGKDLKLSHTPIEWPQHPAFSPESAACCATVLQSAAAGAFLKKLSGKYIYMLVDDQIRALRVMDPDFWQQLDSLWNAEVIAYLWNRVLTVGKPVDIATELQQFTAYPWLLLQWADAQDILQQGSAMWLPQSDCFQPDSCSATVPFYLRVQITLTIAALVSSHLNVWRKAQNDVQLSANLIAESSRKPYPWQQIADWQRVIFRWSNSDSLSYEDGDFLNDIIQTHNVRENWKALQQFHRDYGLRVLEDV